MVFQCFCLLTWRRKRPKITPRRLQDGLKEVLFRCSKLRSILVRFGLDFGCLLGGLLAPKRGPKIDQIRVPEQGRPQEAPRRPQEAPRELPRGPKKPSEGLKRLQKLAQEAPEGPKRALKRHQEPHPQDPLTTKPRNQQAVKQSNQGQGGRRHRASALKIRRPQRRL